MYCCTFHYCYFPYCYSRFAIDTLHKNGLKVLLLETSNGAITVNTTLGIVTEQEIPAMTKSYN